MNEWLNKKRKREKRKERIRKVKEKIIKYIGIYRLVLSQVARVKTRQPRVKTKFINSQDAIKFIKCKFNNYSTNSSRT
jgi:hypothetical protein